MGLLRIFIYYYYFCYYCYNSWIVNLYICFANGPFMFNGGFCYEFDQESSILIQGFLFVTYY